MFSNIVKMALSSIVFTFCSVASAEAAVGTVEFEALSKQVEGIYGVVETYAAPGYLEALEARKEARPLAQIICNQNGYDKLVDFYIDKAETFRVTPYNADDEFPYLIIDQKNESPSKVELLKLETKWVFNNPLEAYVTSMLARDMDVWETHFVPHWTFKNVRCLQSN